MPQTKIGDKAGADPAGGAPAPPPNIGKNLIFWRKIMIFIFCFFNDSIKMKSVKLIVI
jgi:hypothetical protein